MAYGTRTKQPSGLIEGVQSGLGQWLSAQPQVQQTKLIAEAKHRQGMANFLSQMETLGMIKDTELGYQIQPNFWKNEERFKNLRAELINGSPVKNLLKWTEKDGTLRDSEFEGYTYMGADKGWVINTIRDDGKPAQLTEGATDDEVNDQNLIQMTQGDVNGTFQAALSMYPQPSVSFL